LLKALPGIITEGISSQASTALTLLLIWTLSVMLYKDLQTGNYLAGILSSYMSLQLLPLIFFLLAGTIAMLMGTAWGTMTMLIPLGLGMLPSLLGISTPLDLTTSPLLFALIGAIVSGSVVGNHVSPIADVMLMTATTSGAYHIDVVKTQMSLALPTVFSASCAFGLLGILIQHYNSSLSAAISILVGLIVNVIVLNVLAWKTK